MTIRNKHKLNEVSAELMRRAAKKQREVLQDEQTLKSISAWQYLKKLKRADDFDAYAVQIANAINNGNIGSSNDPEVGEQVSKQSTTPNHVDLNSVSVIARKKQIKEIRKRIGGAMQRYEEPIVPHFNDENVRRKGVYSIIYRSSLDDDIASIWVDAYSISNAISEALHDFWDIKEIIDVIYNGKNDNYPTEHTFDVGDSPKVINLDDYASVRDAAPDIISTMTDGEFNNLDEIIADKNDDETTERCVDGNMYEGVDNENNKWKGRKASYREILNSGNYRSNSDYDIEIVTDIDINESNLDKRIRGRFNYDAFKETLKRGIVHFVYIKKDGTERQAFGTINGNILKANGISAAANNRIKNPSNNVIVYYDMTSKAWRSCLKNNVTMIYDESYKRL